MPGFLYGDKNPDKKISFSRVGSFIVLLTMMAIIIGALAYELATIPKPVYIEPVIHNGAVIQKGEYVNPRPDWDKLSSFIEGIFLWGSSTLVALYGLGKGANMLPDMTSRISEAYQNRKINTIDTSGGETK